VRVEAAIERVWSFRVSLSAAGKKVKKVDAEEVTGCYRGEQMCATRTADAA